MKSYEFRKFEAELIKEMEGKLRDLEMKRTELQRLRDHDHWAEDDTRHDLIRSLDLRCHNAWRMISVAQTEGLAGVLVGLSLSF